MQPKEKDPWVFEQTRIERAREEKTLVLTGDTRGDERSTRATGYAVLQQICRAGHHPVVTADAHEVTAMGVNDYYSADFAIWSDNAENGNGRLARLHSFRGNRQGTRGDRTNGGYQQQTRDADHCHSSCIDSHMLAPPFVLFLKLLTICYHQIKVALFDALGAQCQTRAT